MSIKDIYVDTKDVVESEIKLREAQVKSAYDELESISAKVKVWIKLNKVRLAIDAGIFLAGIIIGAII
jgi:hypothetical protein